MGTDIRDRWPVGACGREGHLVFRVVACERNEPVLKFVDLPFRLSMPWSYMAEAEPITEDEWLIACLTT